MIVKCPSCGGYGGHFTGKWSRDLTNPTVPCRNCPGKGPVPGRLRTTGGALALDGWTGTARYSPPPAGDPAGLEAEPLYRYSLVRTWPDGYRHRASERSHVSTVNFLMLNPSKATAEKNDPTVRRCMGYARAWGYGRLVVTNLFAYRSTDPKGLEAVDDPVGPDNNRIITQRAHAADLTIAAWGEWGYYRERGREVAEMLTAEGIPLFALAVTQFGAPRHPLRLAGDLEPIPWTWALSQEIAARKAASISRQTAAVR